MSKAESSELLGCPICGGEATERDPDCLTIPDEICCEGCDFIASRKHWNALPRRSEAIDEMIEGLGHYQPSGPLYDVTEDGKVRRTTYAGKFADLLSRLSAIGEADCADTCQRPQRKDWPSCGVCSCEIEGSGTCDGCLEGEIGEGREVGEVWVVHAADGGAFVSVDEVDAGYEYMSRSCDGVVTIELVPVHGTPQPKRDDCDDCKDAERWEALYERIEILEAAAGSAINGEYGWLGVDIRRSLCKVMDGLPELGGTGLYDALEECHDALERMWECREQLKLLLNRERDIRLVDLEAQRRRMQDDLDAANATIADLTAEFDELNKTYGIAVDVIAERDERIGELEGELDTQQKQLKSAAPAVTLYHDKRRELDAERLAHGKTREKLLSITEQLDTATTQGEHREEALTAARDELSENIGELDRLRDGINRLKRFAYIQGELVPFIGGYAVMAADVHALADEPTEARGKREANEGEREAAACGRANESSHEIGEARKLLHGSKLADHFLGPVQGLAEVRGAIACMVDLLEWMNGLDDRRAKPVDKSPSALERARRLFTVMTEHLHPDERCDCATLSTVIELVLSHLEGKP